MIVSVLKADYPHRVNAVELVVEEAIDIPFQPLSVLVVVLLLVLNFY